MKGERSQETSDGRKNRPGKLNYIGRNKYKILTFVLAGLVIANATGLTGWIVDRKTNFPVVLWAGSGGSGGGSVCDGLNKGQCGQYDCCVWQGSKSSGECIDDCPLDGEICRSSGCESCNDKDNWKCETSTADIKTGDQCGGFQGGNAVEWRCEFHRTAKCDGSVMAADGCWVYTCGPSVSSPCDSKSAEDAGCKSCGELKS